MQRRKSFDPVLHGALLPSWQRLQSLATTWLRSLDLGRLHVSLLYVLATVLVLLFYLSRRLTP
jgi:hypothetical protein